MKELEDFIKKDMFKKYLDIIMILDEIAKNENIMSFTYKDNTLLVQIGVNDYYKISLEKEV